MTFSAQSNGPGSHTTLIFVTNVDRAPAVAAPASVAVVEIPQIFDWMGMGAFEFKNSSC